VCALEHLGLLALDVEEGSNVCRDVVAAERDDNEVAQDVLLVDGDGGCLSTEINECTSRALLGIGEQIAGKQER
jgi:hypothetical protein